MRYRVAIKVYWRDCRFNKRDEPIKAPPSPFYLGLRAQAVIERKCRRYGSRAKRHTLFCCSEIWGRQLPEQGEPEVVACVVEQPKALVSGFEELERSWPAGPEGRPSGYTGPAVPKPPLGKLLPWCMKCQQRPCIGDGCAERYRLLARFGVLHAYADRSDIEEREVHALQAQLAAAGVDTGWEIVPRRKK